MTQHTEQDIVERAERAMHQSGREWAYFPLMCDIIKELKHLRAERDAAIVERDTAITDGNDRIEDLHKEADAAARDMRERCAKVADGVASGWTLTPGGIARQDAAEDIAERIRALPLAVIATERGSHD